MKSRKLLIAIAIVTTPFFSQAQTNKNVGIGTNAPDPSAVLDISSNSKGILIPRLSSAQRMAIQAPANGLLVYDVDSVCMYYYNNFQWSSLCHPGTASNGIVMGIVNGSQDVQLGSPLTRNTDIPLSGKKLTFSGAGNIGMGNANPDPSAILDLSNSNNTGMIIPKVALSKTTVTAPVTNPAPALMVYNTATANDVQPGIYYWDNAKWVRLFATNLPVVSTVSVTAPIVNTGTATDPNIGLTTSDLTGSTVVTIAGGTNKLAGTGVTSVDVVGAQGGILYGTGTSSDFTPTGNGGQYLSSNGTSAPTWNTGKDLNGSSVISVSNGAGQLVGATNASMDVVGPVGTVLYGTGTSSAFTSQGLNGQVLSSTGAGAPIWINPNAALLSSNLTGSTVVNVTNGTGKVVGAGNAMVDVIGAAGGVMYGTGTSSNFTTAGTTGQYLQSNAAGAPTWVNGNNVTGSTVVNVTNGNNQVVGSTGMGIDVTGTNGGVMYGTGTSSNFTPAGTAGQVLRSTGAGAPVWSSPNATLSTVDVTTPGTAVTITNGANQVVGSSNMTIDVAGTQGGVLYGTGGSSAFSTAGTAGQYLQSNGTGAPTWATINTTTSDLVSPGGSTVVVTNGTNKVFGTGNATVDVVGTNGGVQYGTGTSSAFTAAGTSGQILKSNGAAAPAWVNPNTTLTTTNIVGAGAVNITNGTAQTIGTGNPTIDVRGTAGGVMYGTGAGTSAAFTGVGTSGQVLTSNAAGAPTWNTLPPGISCATTNAVVKSNGTSGVCSQILDDATGVGINATPTASEKLTVAGAALSGINGTTTSATAGRYGVHGSGVSGIDGYLGYIGATPSIGGVSIINPAGYFTTSNNGAGSFTAISQGGATQPASMGLSSAWHGGYFVATYLNASGVVATAAGAQGTGIIGSGNNAGGFALTAGQGGAFTGTATGVFAYAPTAGVGQSIYTQEFTNIVRVNYWSGALQYKINGGGTVSTVVKDTHGDEVILHAPETPEVYFQDYGSGKLVNGKTHIDIDPIVAKNVTINNDHPLRVFVQLEGDCNGVYITNKTTTGFDVVELKGGTSNVPFQWTITCNRANEDMGGGRISRYADARLEKAGPHLEISNAGSAPQKDASASNK